MPLTPGNVPNRWSNDRFCITTTMMLVSAGAGVGVGDGLGDGLGLGTGVGLGLGVAVGLGSPLDGAALCEPDPPQPIAVIKKAISTIMHKNEENRSRGFNSKHLNPLLDTKFSSGVGCWMFFV